MASFKKILLAFGYGLWDSTKGIALVFYIDKEIYRQNAEKETERLRHITRRSPSPVPSSASAMFEEELHYDNPDERSIESLITQTPSEPAIPFTEWKIAKKFFKCCILNGGFTWMSIVLFEQILLPTLKLFLILCYGTKSQELLEIWNWLQSILYLIFSVMWVLPMLLLCKVVSSLWFADIANEAYKVRKGAPNLIPNVSKLVADFLFNFVVQALFLVQSMLVKFLPFPYVGGILYYIHLCLLYSLYSFEYKWFNMGWELHRRLNYIEMNWPYFIGFGLPLTVLTNMSSCIIASGCLFSTIFPLFILSGNEGKPIVGSCETPLRLFSPTIFVSNLMFGGRRSKKNSQQIQNSYQQENVHNNTENQQRFRKSSIENTSTIKQPQFRYPQPPQRISPVRLMPERNFRSDFSRSQIRYNESTRTLIPTPVPGAPCTPTSTPTLQKSTSKRR